MELDLSRSELEEMLNSSCSSYYFKFEERKKMLVECHWNCFLKCKGVREYFVPGSQIDTSVVTCKPEINKAKKLIKLVRKRNIHY
jgi:hypothetical protein